MTSIVTDFKSIKRILDRQEQKAEFEAKNPKEEPAYLWPYGVAAVPYAEPEFIAVDRWVIEEIERITGISNVKI